MVYMLLLVGIIAGSLIGIIGIGAGVIMVPGMIYLGGLSFQEAVGITLLMQTLPVGIAGAYQYWEKGLMPLLPASMIAIGMLLGISAGGYIATGGYVKEEILRTIFGIIAIVTGAHIILTRGNV
jgi:uncharacterized membrane protein YfcA